LWIKKNLQAYTYYAITLIVISPVSRTKIFERANYSMAALRWVLTIWFVIPAVVANEVGVCLRVEIFYSMPVVCGSSKIIVRYYSNGRDGRFEFPADDGSNSRDD